MRRAEGNGQRAAVYPVLGLVASTWDGRKLAMGSWLAAIRGPDTTAWPACPVLLKLYLSALAGCFGCPGAGMTSTGHCLLWDHRSQWGAERQGFTAREGSASGTSKT